MTINRMHDLLDQLTQWATDVRAELPPRPLGDMTPGSPTETSPLANLGLVLEKLKRTSDLPAGMRRANDATDTPAGPTELARQMARERLDEWLVEARLLDAQNLDEWARHRRLLRPYINGGYEAEAQAAFDQFIRVAFDAEVGYNPDTRTFYYLVSESL